MSDEELTAAMRHGELTERDRARIAAEADRRDAEALLDRARPDGRALAVLITSVVNAGRS
ncbi:hypothetical protein ACIP96_26835 [Streptomyces nigra]|uniref:hypothetical protein n=1 Tax=Streptomyces nigra TaxID=1827580 RepID=UPI00380B6BE7